MAALPVLEMQAGDQDNTVVARDVAGRQAGSISTCSISVQPGPGCCHSHSHTIFKQKVLYTSD